MGKETSDSEEQSRFTRRDRWMIATFAITAVVAIILFIANLGLLLKLEGKIAEQQKQYDDEIQAVKKDLNASLANVKHDLLKQIGDGANASEGNTNNSLAQQVKELETRVNNLTEKHDEYIIQTAMLAGWSDLGNGSTFQVFTDKKVFADAKKDCARYGGQLASLAIRSPTMRRQILESVPEEFANVWIGLHRLGTNNKWIWLDGVPYNSSTTPSKSSLSAGGNSKCAVALREEMKVEDKSCEDDFVYACEVVL